MALQISNTNEHHAKGIVVTIAVHTLLLLAFFWCYINIPEKKDDEITGIIVNFGTADAGKQVIDPATTSQQPTPDDTPQKSSSASSAATEQVIDQKIEKIKDENAIALSTEKQKKKDKSKEVDKKAESKPNKNKATTDTKKTEAAKKTPTPVNEKKKEEPKVDDRALFTKKDNKNNNQQASQGNDAQDIFTDKGKSTSDNASQDADDYASPYASALSSKGITANLNGRVLKFIPEVKQRFQTNGKVVITIKVDQTGKVIQVDQDISKSTTNDPALVKIALDTAKKALFNQDLSASLRQSGSISFEFKVQ